MHLGRDEFFSDPRPCHITQTNGTVRARVLQLLPSLCGQRIFQHQVSDPYNSDTLSLQLPLLRQQWAAWRQSHEHLLKQPPLKPLLLPCPSPQISESVSLPALALVEQWLRDGCCQDLDGGVDHKQAAFLVLFATCLQVLPSKTPLIFPAKVFFPRFRSRADLFLHSLCLNLPYLCGGVGLATFGCSLAKRLGTPLEHHGSTSGATT